MNTFIENVKEYLSERQLNQKYVSLMTGWNASKVSRIFSGANIKDNDKVTLADALGESVEFFLNGTKEMMKVYSTTSNQMAFCAGKLSEEDCVTAEYIVDLFRFYEELMDC